MVTAKIYPFLMLLGNFMETAAASPEASRRAAEAVSSVSTTSNVHLHFWHKLAGLLERPCKLALLHSSSRMSQSGIFAKFAMFLALFSQISLVSKAREREREQAVVQNSPSTTLLLLLGESQEPFRSWP